MKKRFLSIVSLILVFCSVLSFPAFAVEVDPEPEDPIEPDNPYVDIAYYNCYCSINGNGRAYCSSFAQTATTTYTIHITIWLMRYENGVWQQYAGPWSNSGTRYCTSYAYYYVPSGYYYCTGSAVTVRTSSGEYVESATIYSPVKYY